MSEKKIGDFTGYSTSGIHEAVQDAIEKIGHPARFEVIETRCSRADEHRREYEVTLAAFAE